LLYFHSQTVERTKRKEISDLHVGVRRSSSDPICQFAGFNNLSITADLRFLSVLMLVSFSTFPFSPLGEVNIHTM
jgi:hypothetical protein